MIALCDETRREVRLLVLPLHTAGERCRQRIEELERGRCKVAARKRRAHGAVSYTHLTLPTILRV